MSAETAVAAAVELAVAAAVALLPLAMRVECQPFHSLPKPPVLLNLTWCLSMRDLASQGYCLLQA
jgi:hypothetical protein